MAAPPSSPDRTRPRSPPRRCAIQASRATTAPAFYYGARYYLSWQGRWLNPDPAGPADGANLMEFVSGNPLSFIDPDGHGKTDPSKQASTDWGFDHLKTLVQSMLKTYMYTIANAPRHAYIEAPRQLMKRFSWDENVRKQTREAGRGRLEESKLLYYNLSIVLGMDPERFLPAVVLPWIKPQTKPWALVDVPSTASPFTTSCARRSAARSRRAASWAACSATSPPWAPRWCCCAPWRCPPCRPT